MDYIKSITSLLRIGGKRVKTKLAHVGKVSKSMFYRLLNKNIKSIPPFFKTLAFASPDFAISSLTAEKKYQANIPTPRKKPRTKLEKLRFARRVRRYLGKKIHVAIYEVSEVVVYKLGYSRSMKPFLESKIPKSAELVQYDIYNPRQKIDYSRYRGYETDPKSRFSFANFDENLKSFARSKERYE